MTPQQAAYLKEVIDAIVDTVKEADPIIGAPGGHLYAALMAFGCSLATFEALMSALVAAGKVTKRGECYFPVQA